MKLQKGYLKVAGLFFSTKKCAIHANPYPANNEYSKYIKSKVMKNLM
jgi:hypothetical protein